MHTPFPYFSSCARGRYNIARAQCILRVYYIIFVHVVHRILLYCMYSTVTSYLGNFYGKTYIVVHLAAYNVQHGHTYTPCTYTYIRVRVVFDFSANAFARPPLGWFHRPWINNGRASRLTVRRRRGGARAIFPPSGFDRNASLCFSLVSPAAARNTIILHGGGYIINVRPRLAIQHESVYTRFMYFIHT